MSSAVLTIDFESRPRLTYFAMAKKKNPHAVALGKLGGSKGGKKRAAQLSPERRREIAQKAIATRWAKKKMRPDHSEDKPRT